MRDYVRLAGILLIVCAIAAASLGYTNEVTYDKIQEQREIADNEARKEVLPGADEFERLDDSIFSSINSNGEYALVTEIYIAKAGGNVAGYAVKTVPKGYGGNIEVVAGIAIDGKIRGVKVGNNTETPGLGKNAETSKFREQFSGKAWDRTITVINSGTPKDDEIAAVSGATITSKAVTEGVNQALKAARELSGKK